MFAMYDGVQIWNNERPKCEEPAKEEIERLERMWEHCMKIDKEHMEYFLEYYKDDYKNQESVGC